MTALLIAEDDNPLFHSNVVVASICILWKYQVRPSLQYKVWRPLYGAANIRMAIAVAKEIC